MRIFLKSSPNHFNGREGWKPDMICFHQTGGTSEAVAIQYYRNPAAQCCPNWVISINGDIYQLVDPNNGAWANGTATVKSDPKYYGYSLSKLVRERKTNANYYTYSIEFVHCQWGNITEEQIAAAVNLIKKVIIPHMRKNGVTPIIDREHLVGHSDITPKTRDPERYNCPGKLFPYDEIISRVLGKTPEKPVEKPAAVAVGDKVTIKDSATTYAGVATKIPAGFKGSKQVYTVSKVLGDKALLKELYSWVWIRDLEVNHILGRCGPDGELGASLRYLSQRFAQTEKCGIALLTDIGTEELGHLEMIGSIVTQLTKGEGAKSFDKYGVGDYYIDHANGVYPASASGVPFSAAYLQSKADPIADIMEDMAAEQKARATYDNILRISDDPDVTNIIRYLREREVVHFQRFGELLDMLQSKIK